MARRTTHSPSGARSARSRLFGLGFMGALVVMLALPGVPMAEAPRDIVVIVHAGNPETSVTRDFVAQAYLKKITRWPNKSLIRPVDVRQGSDLRERFSEQVLQRSVETVRIYWQQRIFSGRDLPPPELSSELAVVQYVARTPGAIGYVSSVTALEGVKVLRVR